MIIKARSIAHISASLEYITKDGKKHEVLSSDGLDLSSIETMKSDFKLFQKDRVKNGYISVVISPNAKDSLNDKDYITILQETLKELKLENRQYIAVTHNDTNHKHIHVILNRIDYNNQTWNDHHVAWKCQEACKNICATLGLHTAYENASKSKKSIENEYDELRESIRQELKSIVKLEMYSAESLEEFHGKLEKRGVKIHIQQFKNGLFGTSLEFKGMKFKASKIDRKLSVSKDGDTYKANPQLHKIFEKNRNERLAPNSRNTTKDMNSIKDGGELLAYMKNKASNYAKTTKGILASGGNSMRRHRKSDDLESEEEQRKLKRQAEERGMGR